MVWARLDDTFFDHPKVERLSDAAFRAHVGALVYCNRYLTDGAVSAAQVSKLTKPKLRAELIAAGVWEEREDGIVIHDFLEYNRTAEQVKAERAASAERLRRWREQRNAVGNGVTDGEGNGASNTVPSRPDPSRPDEGSKEPLETSALDVDEPLVEQLLDEIEDRDELTERFILGLAPKASEAGLVHTIEALRRRRSRKPTLVSESKYARATLEDYIKTRGEAA